MSKVKSTVYGLKFGHPTEYRRTVEVPKGKGTVKYILVFQPNTPYTLTDPELDGCEDLITNGLLVPWKVDDRGHQSPPGRPSEDHQPKSARTETVADSVTDESDSAGDETERKRSLRIDDLELSEGTRAALHDAGLTTVRKIEAHREQNGGRFNVAGIGDSKAHEIDHAIAKAAKR